VKLLLDTHLLLWAAVGNPALPHEARLAIEDQDNSLYFSVASLWEIVIKSQLGRDDFQIDARLLRRNLLDAGYAEMSIEAPHTFEVAHLPPLHKDPFDRLLIGQAIAEGILLFTHDNLVGQYHNLAPIRLV
jgi:PIN domain nuclease of toxin-antitoxin system